MSPLPTFLIHLLLIAPKRSHSSSSSASNDTGHFISRDAFDRFKDGLLKKVLIAERGIVADDIEIASVVESRRWQKFIQQP